MSRSPPPFKPYNEPLQLTPNVEIALQALTHTLLSAQMLTKFLNEQSGPDWCDVDPMLHAADRDLRRAQFWIRKKTRQKRRRKGS